MNAARKRRLSFRRAVRRVTVTVLLVVIGVFIYLSLFGLPDWLVLEFRKWINASPVSFAVETDDVRLDFLRGFRLRDVRLYRKGVVGPPAAEAGTLRVAVNPRSLFGEESLLRSVKITDGILRPEMLVGPEDTEQRDRDDGPLAFEVELEDCRVLGVNIESMHCNVRREAQDTLVENMVASLHGGGYAGEVRGRTILGDAGIAGHMETRIDPRFITPTLQTWKLDFVEKLVNSFHFGELPHCEIDYRIPFQTPNRVEVDGTFGFKQTSYRGVEALHMDGDVSVQVEGSNVVVDVTHVLIVRPEGNLQGSFTIDTKKETVAFKGTSSLYPPAVLDMIGILTNGFIDRCIFDGPVQATAEGVADITGCESMNFQVDASGRGMGIKPFRTEQASLVMQAIGPVLTFTNIHARIYDGSVEAVAVFTFPTNVSEMSNTTYSIMGKFTDADFRQFAKVFAKDTQDYKGQFSGWMKIKGELEDLSTMEGKGRVRVKDGRVFMLPLFGGLSDALAKIIPGLKFVMRQTDAIAEFEVKNGKIYSDNIEIQGDVLSVMARGNYTIETGELNFDVQIKFMKDSRRFLDAIIRFITVPITKLLLEFELTGTPQEPKWKPFTGTADLFEMIGLKKKSRDDPPKADQMTDDR